MESVGGVLWDSCSAKWQLGEPGRIYVEGGQQGWALTCQAVTRLRERTGLRRTGGSGFRIQDSGSQATIYGRRVFVGLVGGGDLDCGRWEVGQRRGHGVNVETVAPWRVSVVVCRHGRRAGDWSVRVAGKEGDAKAGPWHCDGGVAG